jgi:hypothetical protein
MMPGVIGGANGEGGVSVPAAARARVTVDTYSVLGLNERIIDSNDLDIGMVDGVSEDDTANTTETVDSNLDRSHDFAKCEFVFLWFGILWAVKASEDWVVDTKVSGKRSSLM